MSARRSIGFLIHPGEQRAAERGIARAQSCGYGVWTAVEHPETSVAEHADGAALLVTVGGDGTFLYGARLAAPFEIPVLGVNCGRLGFLADVEPRDLPDALSRFARGTHVMQHRSLIEVTVTPDDGAPAAPALALNEVVVRAHGVSVLRLHVTCGGDQLGEFDADGVVVATATGSTAYALSAGGPLVDPRVRALVVAPLASHTLGSRPVVLPDGEPVRVDVGTGDVAVAVDGLLASRLGHGGSVEVRPGPDLAVVRFPGSPTFLERLRAKFRYGVPNKPAAGGGPGGELAAEDAEERYGAS